MRLLEAPDTGATGYDVAGLSADLRGRAVGIGELTIAHRLASTNDHALERAAQAGPAEIVACLADTQTAGRGRRGKQWHSPPGHNLYLSLAWRTSAPLAYDPSALPLAVGVGVAEALAALAGVEATLKWPNDLYVEGGKLGGILLESRVNGADMRLVAGIGINHLRNETLLASVDQAVRFLDDHAPGVTREALAGALIAACEDVLRTYWSDGIGAYRESWSRRDWLRDRRVRVHDAEHGFEGIARGIDAGGELLVETAGGMRRCHSGEVSVRAA